MKITLFGLCALMLTVATCCGQNANTGTLPGPVDPLQPVQYLSADSSEIQLEQQANGDTDVVFAVVGPSGKAVISDSQGNIYPSCNSGILFAFVTTARAGANTISVQNARAICVVEFGNLIPVSSGSFSGIGFLASVNAGWRYTPARAVCAVLTIQGASAPLNYQGALTSMLGGKCVIGSSALLIPGSCTITVPLISMRREGEVWNMLQVTLSKSIK
jgi:hypothetical protein